MALIDQLVAYWPLDEVSGTRDDAHTNNYQLTDNNTVTSGTGLVYGTAASCEVDNVEYLSITDNADLSGGAGKSFTIALWVNAQSLIGFNRGVVGKGVNGSGFEYSMKYSDAISRFRWTVASATGEANATFCTQGGGSGGGAAPSTATWYLLIGWHDATNDQIGIATSVDGISTAYTAAYTFDVWDSGGDVEIGSSGSYFRDTFDGLIGPVMFWSRALTQQDRIDLYNSGAGVTYAAMAGGGGSSYLVFPRWGSVRR